MVVFAEFITGMSVGIEIFIGEDCQPEDKLAIKLDLLIIRFTFIVLR